MKKNIFLFLSILVATFIFAEKRTVTLSNIKVFIDESEYSWKNKSEKPQLVSGSKSSVNVETVFSFSLLQPQKQMTLDSLEKEVKQTELRLNESGYFYSATVDILPSRKSLDKRTVIITVKSGFLWRFGGGSAYGVFGKANFFGKRLEAMCYLGWNKNGASILYERAFNTPLILAGNIFWNGPASLLQKEENACTSLLVETFTIGTFFTPDLRFCIDLIFKENFPTGFVPEDFCISPYLQYMKYFSSKINSDSEARFYYYPVSENNFSLKAEVASGVNFTPFNLCTFAFCIATGLSFNDSSNNDNFDLNENNECISSNRVLNNRTIRSAYKDYELIANEYFFTSFEIRFNAAKFLIPPAFSVELQPFVFSDIAIVDAKGRDAFGGGLRVLFDNPVFAYFTFCYGINHEGNIKFCFAATKGF